MLAQKCKTCGQHHWERVCPNPPAVARSRRAPPEKLPEFVTKPTSRVPALEAEIEVLQAEVKRLKRALAEAANKPANTANSPEAANASANSKPDRKTYMRELMRKKRAAKAKAPP